MSSLAIDTNDLSILIAVALYAVYAMAFLLTVRNAWKLRAWKRRMADIMATGVVAVYWFVVLVSRLVYGYVGPSLAFTLAGAFVFAIVGVHFLGIALAQRDVYK